MCHLSMQQVSGVFVLIFVDIGCDSSLTNFGVDLWILLWKHRFAGFSVVWSSDTPLKINMEHNHGGLEDHVPF